MRLIGDTLRQEGFDLVLLQEVRAVCVPFPAWEMAMTVLSLSLCPPGVERAGLW